MAVLAGRQHAVVHRMYTRTSFAGKVCSVALLKQISADYADAEGVTLEATSSPETDTDLSRLAYFFADAGFSKSSNLLAPMVRRAEGADGGLTCLPPTDLPAVRRGDNQTLAVYLVRMASARWSASPLLQPGDQADVDDAARRLGLLRTQRPRSTSPPGRHRCPLSAQKPQPWRPARTGLAARHRHPTAW